MRNTNQTVAQLGEEADMVAIPERSTFIETQSFHLECFKTLAPSCDVMRVVVGVFGFKQRALFGLYIERSISSFEDPF